MKPLPCVCSANKARAQEAEMLARANEQRKEASPAATTAAHAPVSISAIALLGDDASRYVACSACFS